MRQLIKGLHAIKQFFQKIYLFEILIELNLRKIFSSPIDQTASQYHGYRANPAWS